MQWTEFTFILKPSAIAGIGVFATHDLPAGIRIFSEASAARKMKISDVPSAFINYCPMVNDQECVCPEQFDRMEIRWYLNHSYQPNIKKIAEGHFVTMREIQAGEEILIDYNQFNEPEHLKEDYYKISSKR
jgi:hypothetical protein